jgi:tetratricopeptide (TPR) repeat protein
VQHRQEQFENSRLNLLAAIQTIEGVDGKLSTDLIQPLNRLGRTESALGEYDKATESFQRAVHISHVHSGPQNVAQIESLEAIADIYLRGDNIEEARNTQRRILAYRARADGTDSVAYLPALTHYAEWMHKLGLYNTESNTYLDILTLQERHYGPDHPDLIPTLLRLAFSVHNVSASLLDDKRVHRMRSPDYYLGRAMEIARDRPQSDWKIYALTALKVGDYFTLAQRFGRARAAYRDAWRQLSAEPSGLAVRGVELEVPRQLSMPPLPRYYEDEDPLPEPDATDNFMRGTITAEFGVNKTGESVRIRLVESEPADLAKIERRLVSSLRSMMHRPRMKDGNFVEAERLTYVYEFFYREGDQ